jgi:predicted dehydrogenase
MTDKEDFRVKIIFFGLGSIGQRHAKILLDNYDHELFAFRTKKGQYKQELPVKEVYSWGDVEKLKPDIAFITNPTSLHIETALKCAKNGYRLFIEKPIDSKIKGLAELINIVRDKRLPSYVAYNLRFHPVIKKLKEYINQHCFLHMRVSCTSFLPDWRPEQDHKQSYSSNLKLGGGVLLDLSHEIDCVDYLLDGINKIEGNYGRKSDITIDSDDYADILTESTKGMSNIHINFLSHITMRKIYIDFKGLSIVGDVNNGIVREYKHNDIMNVFEYEIDNNSIYMKQLKYFFDHIDDCNMMNNLDDAASLFNKVIDFKMRQ